MIKLHAWPVSEDFLHHSLTVTWYGESGERVLPIKGYLFGRTRINVKWEPQGNTIFGEFNEDGHTMAQQPNTSGDMGSRRALLALPITGVLLGFGEYGCVINAP